MSTTTPITRNVWCSRRFSCLSELSYSITHLDSESNPLFVYGVPQALFPKLFECWKVTQNGSWCCCPISRYRDIATIKTATIANVEAINCSGRALWGSDEIFRLGRGGNLKDKNDLIFYGLKVGNILIVSAPASYPNFGHTAFYSSKDS